MYNPVLKMYKGNVRNDESSIPLTTLSDALHSNRKEQEMKTNKIRELFKKEISEKIEETDSSTYGFLSDHNYYKPDSELCKLYQICGFICFKSHLFTSCVECRSSLEDLSNDSSSVFSVLTDIKSFGKLKKPSPSFFNLIRNIEPKIETYLRQERFVSNSVTSLVSSFDKILHHGIGCGKEDHITELLPNIISYYISTRMYFFTRSYNVEKNTTRIKSKQDRKKVKLN